MLKDIMEEFDKLCIKTEDGECKYWNPEAFGYSENDSEAPLDKFFPEEIKAFLEKALRDYQKKLLEGMPNEEPDDMEYHDLITWQEENRGTDSSLYNAGYNDCLAEVKSLIEKSLTE
jgi:hypothetical protein